MEIIKKATPTAPKALIYGLSGVGKSTLAGQIKNSLFIDIEGGLNNFDFDRTPQVLSYDQFYETMMTIFRGKKEYDNLIIDSVDWLVRLITERSAGIDKNHLDATLNKSNGGYGNGKQVLQNEIRTRLIPMFDTFIKYGYGITLIAHADKKDMMDADGFDVSTITPKIDDNTMHAFVEWCDFVYYLKSDAGGKRSLVLSSDGNALAKNRVGLTGTVELDKVDINTLLRPQAKVTSNNN